MQTKSQENYHTALHHIQTKDFNNAQNLLERLLVRHPEHPDLLHLLGICCLETQQTNTAVDYLKKATVIQRKNARFQYHYGISLIKTDRLEEAKSAFRDALKHNPDFIDARYNLGKALKESGKFDEAVAVYKSLLNQKPNHIDALYNLANLYAEEDQCERAISVYTKLLNIVPHHLKARINSALLKSRMGRRSEAISDLEKVMTMDPMQPEARKVLRKLYSSMIPGWHIDMINDDVRNEAYDRAIRATVKMTDHVLEIGTGSGLLAMMAARAGARKVTTCEMVEPLADCARKIIRKNGYEDRIRVVGKKSTSLNVGAGMDLEKKADVLIAEVFDVGLLGEHFLPALFHAKRNLLKAGTVVIPAAAKIKAILAECDQLRRVNPIHYIDGFDLSEFNVFRSPGYRQFDMTREDYCPLSDPFDVLTLDFNGSTCLSQTVKLDVPSITNGTCHAVIFWFELIIDSETLFSSHHQAGSNHWKQAIQFFDSDHPTVSGNNFHLEVNQNSTDLVFRVLSQTAQ
jgi:tetratricopeptide (TPR) repeat protein